MRICWVSTPSQRLSKDAFDQVAVDVRQPMVAALIAEGQAAVVDAEQMQHRRVQVVDVDAILGDVVAEVVGRAVGIAGADAAAGQPEREAARMMVATVVRRRQRCWQRPTFQTERLGTTSPCCDL